MIQRLKKLFSEKSDPHKHLSVKIIDECSQSLPINPTKIIKKLLKHIPNEHLIGLDSITLMDNLKYKKHAKYKEAAGLYYSKYKTRPAYIEISIEHLCSYDPYVLRLIPFLGEKYLAEVLFHEIGHHYRHRTHGITKRENEDFADEYSKKYTRIFTRKVVYPWRYVLKPFVWAYKFAKKRGFLEDSETGK
jgi:hypothetical protein